MQVFTADEMFSVYLSVTIKNYIQFNSKLPVLDIFLALTYLSNLDDIDIA